MFLQYSIFRIQYSIDSISAAIGDISTNLYAIYSTFAAKYSAPTPLYIMSTRVEVKSNVILLLHIQACIFDWTYLRFHWRYVDNSMRVSRHICCQIQCTPTGLRNVNTVSCQILCNCRFAYLGFSIQFNVFPLLLVVCRDFDSCYTPHSPPFTAPLGLFAQSQLCVLSNTA